MGRREFLYSASPQRMKDPLFEGVNLVLRDPKALGNASSKNCR